ncbi:MAG: 1-acyl-sn-glycerol-3-phosphate acyltransferase [Sandaracinaceae bacterium]
MTTGPIETFEPAADEPSGADARSGVEVVGETTLPDPDEHDPGELVPDADPREPDPREKPRTPAPSPPPSEKPSEKPPVEVPEERPPITEPRTPPPAEEPPTEVPGERPPIQDPVEAPPVEEPIIPPPARATRKLKKEKATLLRWLHPDGVGWGTDVDAFDPDKIDHARGWMSRVFGAGRYFPIEVEGWENLPPPPVMLVSNHSGGTLFLDSWGLLYAWYGQHGSAARPLHPAVHEMLLGNRFTGSFFAARGAIRADRRLAQRVLARGNDLLVMPGGDLDVWRPYKDRYRVQFAGRTGYAHIALSAGVPIVPVANAGAHETFYVLTDGRRFAEAIRLPEVARASIFPVHLSLPWGIGIGPWPHIPLPAKLRYRFGAAIYPERATAEPTEDEVNALDARVREGVQAQLDALAEG